jgi:TonB family protein
VIQPPPFKTVPMAAQIPPPPPPPPVEEKDDQQAQLDADKLKRMVRNAAASHSGSSTAGGGQKGIQIDGGAGVDIGENKLFIERRIQNIWHRTKSQYSELQRSGRTVVIYFEWHRDGTLVFNSFGTTTGNPALDNEARSAVQNASPYIPIPKEITLDVIQLNVRFTY